MTPPEETEPFISQVELVAGIMKFLKRRGFKALNARQLNAVIRAADEIMLELRNPHTEAKPGCGLAAWLASDSTGVSSLYMARHLAPLAGLGDRVSVEGRDADDR